MSRFPDMFPRVPQPEIAYLASYHHPDEIVQKWRGVNFVKIKCFSDAAMVDCASDRYIANVNVKHNNLYCL